MYDDFIRKGSLQYHVPESWIRAVISVESSWNPSAYRAEPQISDGSYGLMQLLSRTAIGLGFTGDPHALYDPATNINLGAKLLGQLRSQYGDDFRRVYSAYNSGKPDLYKTSTEVGRNVARALAALEKYVTEGVEAVTGSIGQAAQDQPAITGLVILLLLWMWAGKKR